MKKLVGVSEEGLISLIGKRVTFFCFNYIYTGKLISVNEDVALLEDAYLVYETGAFYEKNWKDAQKLRDNWYIKLSAVESFGVLK